MARDKKNAAATRRISAAALRPLSLLGGSLVLCLCLSPSPASAAQIQAICRLKGQEPIRLTGLGLVTGLNGTGDSRLTVMHQALGQALRVLGNPVDDLRTLAAVRNVALVVVTCEIPGAGGREGDLFDCYVTSIGGARSLAGGRLLRAPLTGPLVGDQTPYALAEGPVSVESATALVHGAVPRGAKLTEELAAPFTADGETITLVINEGHASWVTANQVAKAINRTYQTQVSNDAPVRLALALDQKNVVVRIPPFYKSDAVGFVADIMEIEIDERLIHTQAVVRINERTETITVTGEVQLTPVLVAHKNLVVFPGGPAAAVGGAGAQNNEFVPLTSAGQPNQPPMPADLQDLLFALNQARVSAADKIAIIKQLAKSGKLHAQVIFE